MHAIFVVRMRIRVVIYEHRKCAHLSAQCALWENFSMIPVRMTVSITWMFVQRTVPTARTWMAAAVGHTRRTLIVRSGRLRNPCWDRKRGPRRGEGGGISASIPLYANEFVATVSASWMLSEVSSQQLTQAKKTSSPLRRRAQPLATTRIYISNHRETTALRTQTAPSRPVSPVLSCPEAGSHAAGLRCETVSCHTKSGYHHVECVKVRL